jgi:ribosome maturation factor RimP
MHAGKAELGQALWVICSSMSHHLSSVLHPNSISFLKSHLEVSSASLDHVLQSLAHGFTSQL